ncbi:MAG: hypothetical protein PHQ78_00545 [Candidatus Cloacimonetes bacterium]|jgi:hypothetical protein|nr:hypothetical protein [Candidatus Cloacimonadota bacterium]MDD2505797.1 hypothetical protein [Candidatus Cloacimonadota bacterium]MDD4559219.1 hypothetical protein [Candidatus Cloacimonadota bacterium]
MSYAKIDLSDEAIYLPAYHDITEMPSSGTVYLLVFSLLDKKTPERFPS